MRFAFRNALETVLRAYDELSKAHELSKARRRLLLASKLQIYQALCSWTHDMR